MKKLNNRLVLTSAAALAAVSILAPVVWSHCEIPCGIYNDPMRIDMMHEHAQTIEKSMRQIQQLSQSEDKNHNQLTRWVMNKEDHADQLSDIVTQYFMKQRINPADKSNPQAYDAYINQLTLLHQMMIYSMKCKQTTDLDHVTKLRETIDTFKTAYLGKPQTTAHDHPH